jgi:alpha-mannosidase
VDPGTGWLSELVDRASGRSLLARVAEGRGHAMVFDDPSDTWSHGVERYDRRAGTFTPTSIAMIEDGPVRRVVRIEQRFGDSQLREDVILAADERYLEVRVTLDWFEHLRGLKLRIPTAIEAPRATFDIPFGSIERPAEGHEEPGQLWLDVSGRLADGRRAGISVITDAKYAFDVRHGDIGITAVRSPVGAWHDPAQLGDRNDHRYLDQGRQRFRYAILPHAGDWQAAGTLRLAGQLNRLPVTLLEGVHPGTEPQAGELFAVEPACLEVAALKLAEDGSGDAILRLVERHGRPTRALIRLPRWRRPFEVDVAPWSIATVRIPRDPEHPCSMVDLLEDPMTRVTPVAATTAALDAMAGGRP